MATVNVVGGRESWKCAEEEKKKQEAFKFQLWLTNYTNWVDVSTLFINYYYYAINNYCNFNANLYACAIWYVSDGIELTGTGSSDGVDTYK